MEFEGDGEFTRKCVSQGGDLPLKINDPDLCPRLPARPEINGSINPDTMKER